jgi:hypothetical protein
MLYPVVSVGAIVSPHRYITQVSVSRSGCAQSVATPATVTPSVIANRCDSGDRQLREP